MGVITIELSRNIIKKYVEVATPVKITSNDKTVYGTISGEGDELYVKLDGSDVLTPISSTIDVRAGDRVLVLIKNHEAMVLGSPTSPTARLEELRGMGDQITEFGVIIADKVGVGELVAMQALIDELEAKDVEITGKLEANEAEIDTLTAENATINGKLTAYKADIEDLRAKKIDATEVEAKYATIENLEATDLKVTNLDAAYGEFETLAATKFEAIDASIKDLDVGKLNANDADIKYATIENLNAINADVDKLHADVADIDTLIFGSASGTTIQTSFANAVIAQLGNAQIKSAMIDNISADKINAGDINTNNVRVVSEDGRLVISDETIQISDETRVRVQIGKDAVGDYSISIWDADGNLMFSEGGITDSAIKDAIIRNDMVANDANIAASKLDISSLFTEINNSTETINAGRVTIDTEGQTLDVAFTSMSSELDSLGETVSSQGTQLSVIQGQISSKIWQQDIEAATDELGNEVDNLSTKQSSLEQTIDSVSATVSQHTTQIANKADSSAVTEISDKVTELEADIDGFRSTVSETYATKTQLASTDAKVNEATEAAVAAQNTANTAKANAETAQKKANDAATAAANAQQAADDADAKAEQAAADLATAQQNLANVTSRVDATEEEVAAAQATVETAQAAADKAKSDAAAAQSTADTAKANAATAQTAANNAKTAADNAQAAANEAQQAADDAQADVDALAVRVTTAETKITQNSEQIALMAKKTEVTETLGGYYTKEQTDSAISVKADQITQQVSQTYTEKQFAVKEVHRYYASGGSGGDTLTFNPSSAEELEGMVQAAEGLYKVSDSVPTESDFANGCSVVFNDQVMSLTKEEMTFLEDGFIPMDVMFIVPYDNYDADGLIFPEAGVYFGFADGMCVTSLTIPGYTGFFNTVGDTLTWDGDTTGKTGYDLGMGSGLHYHVSEAVPTLTDFANGGSYRISEQLVTFPAENVLEPTPGFLMGGDGIAAFIVVPTDNNSDSGITFEKKGVYLLEGVKYLTIPGYTGFGGGVPQKPTAFPPEDSVWSETEPEFQEGQSLYTTLCTVYNDGSFVYTDVILSSAQEAVNGAIEDISAVRETMTEQISSVVQSTESVILSALESYTPTSSLEELRETIRAELAVLANQITMNFEATSQQINDVDSDLREWITKYSKHISFDENGMTICSSNSSVTIQLDNEEGVVIRRNGVIQSQLVEDNFYTGNIVVEVNERAQFGGLVALPRSKGSLMWVKAGG